MTRIIIRGIRDLLLLSTQGGWRRGRLELGFIDKGIETKSEERELYDPIGHFLRRGGRRELASNACRQPL